MEVVYVIAKSNKGQVKHSIGGVSKRFIKMCEVYRVFAKDWEHLCDFSDQALVDLFNNESYGTRIRSDNGYALGKKWLNVTVKMWREDIQQGLLFKHELYADDKFPHWWLDSVLKNI